MSVTEIVSLAASVIQIADLGSKLSVKLFTSTRRLKQASKSIDALSQEIASNGAILKLLGQTLSGDRYARLCSQSVIDTVRHLVNDTREVFLSLGKFIESNEKSGSQCLGGSGIKQKLNETSLEAMTEEVQSNLKRLKASLLVILNVLVLAEQMLNNEALSILEDQRELVRTLVVEKDANEMRHRAILKAIADKPAGHIYEYVSISGSARPVLGNLNTSAVRPDTRSIPEINALNRGICSDTTLGSVEDHEQQQRRTNTSRAIETPYLALPSSLKRYHNRIHHHTELVQNLLSEISSLRYAIGHATRGRMSDTVLQLHWDEWAQQRASHPHSHFEEILANHREVAQFWSDKMSVTTLCRERNTSLHQRKTAQSESIKSSQYIDRASKEQREIEENPNWKLQQTPPKRHRIRHSQGPSTAMPDYPQHISRQSSLLERFFSRHGSRDYGDAGQSYGQTGQTGQRPQAYPSIGSIYRNIDASGGSHVLAGSPIDPVPPPGRPVASFGTSETMKEERLLVECQEKQQNQTGKQNAGTKLDVVDQLLLHYTSVNGDDVLWKYTRH